MKRAHRQQLGAVIDEVRAWVNTAEEVRHLAAHLPLSTWIDPTAELSLLDSLSQVTASGDLVTAGQLAKTVWFDGRKKLQPAHEAAARLGSFHGQVKAASTDETLAALHGRLAAQSAAERDQLQTLLTTLGSLRAESAEILLDATHMPVTREKVLTAEEDTAMQSLIQVVDLHAPEAQHLLDPSRCATGACSTWHSSARLLRDLEQEADASGLDLKVLAARERVDAQLTTERAQVKNLAEQASTWTARAQAIRDARVNALRNVESTIKTALASAVDVKGIPSTRLIPFAPADADLVPNLKLLSSFVLTSADDSDLTAADELAKTVASRITPSFDGAWKCPRSGTCLAAHNEAARLLESATTVESNLDRLTPPRVESGGNLDRLLDPSLAFTSFLPGDASNVELLDRALTARARAGVGTIINAAKAAKEAAAQAKKAAEDVQANDVANALKAMDLDALRKASTNTERFRTAPLEAYDLHNVWDVLKFQEKYLLASLSGLGETSARAITQASLRLLEAVRDETPVRIDVKRRSKKTGALLDALRQWDAARRFDPSTDEVALAKGLSTLFVSNRSAEHVVSFTQGATTGAARVVEMLTDALKRSVPASTDSDVWTDFLSRPADYFGMLTELGFVTEDEKKMHGDLPEEIIEAVRAKELKRDYLTASLRTYQSFGARFALVQEKVVIGDEMGLGKTVEALAVFTHLRATGHSHFLVVCPAAVVSNWIRETSKHTKLSAARLHGPLWERNYAAKSWIRNGGVAVTTYDLLPWAQEHINNVEVASAVFDEAHYIKNPNAKRSLAAAEVMDSLKYVVLMTGTPLENSVQEFRNLIGYIRSDLSDSAPEFLASKFRKHVAPAYLRRNQEDVLTELPELVEIDEWMGMSDADERSYREAVQEGHFMLMRRAAMLSARSLKVERLLEIVDEAESNGRKVIVFSYFREVLNEVARLLHGEVFGPLTGSMPARDRQTLVDKFAAAGHGAALVAQITAGGVGLNIQSASAVVICEPQLKPTMEAQAIARAHRMGQTNTVQVHRLLSENSVDERIREILADKKQLFDEFARDSVIAEQAPDAVDVTDAELARLVVAAERERLFGQADTKD